MDCAVNLHFFFFFFCNSMWKDSPRDLALGCVELFSQIWATK